jgi:hypothetical protein
MTLTLSSSGLGGFGLVHDVATPITMNNESRILFARSPAAIWLVRQSSIPFSFLVDIEATARVGVNTTVSVG